MADEALGKRPEVLSGAAVRVTVGMVSAVERVDSEVEADMRRDDLLGRLFLQAFKWPPPPMPERLNG